VFNPGGYLIGLVLTLVVGAVAWFGFGRGILDKLDESNARSAGGGPESERILSPRRFAPVVAQVRGRVGRDGRLASVTMRPLSLEFVTTADGGVARGLRWRDGVKGLRPFEENASPGAVSWPISRLDATAPQRIARAISRSEEGDFHLSIGDLGRADSGKLVWILRGTIGERGVAYYAAPDGSRVKRYDPSSPDLSQGARLGRCIQRAKQDPVKLQRCVARLTP
jgi:hypothetical protein